MKIKTYISVITLFCLHNFCSCTLDVTKQLTYAYKGNIVTKNAISDEYIAQWSVSGTLTVQPVSNSQIIMKLDDLKTSMFNGLLQNKIKEAKEYEILKETAILSEPFIINYDVDNLSCISHQRNEPIWSINMKRAIGDIFQVYPDKRNAQENTTLETTIYGLCPITYETREENEYTLLEKIINHQDCKNGYFKHKSNVKPATIMGDYKPVERTTKRSYKINKDDESGVVSYVETSSDLVYKPWPSIKSNQHVVQRQTFKLLNISKIENNISTSKHLIKSSIIVKLDEDITEEFHTQDFIDNYYEYRAQSKDFHLQFKNVSNKDPLQDMYTVVSRAKYEDLQNIFAEIIESNDVEMLNLFYSYLPYIGTGGANKLIKQISKTETNEQNVKLLAMLPTYIFEPTAALYKELEDLMDLEYSNEIVKNTAILCSASIFTNFYQKKIINNSKLIENIDKYYNLYKESKSHEDDMITLLALVNIGSVLTTDSILEIIKKKPSRHIQYLAIYGFKPQLINHPNLVFTNFWPTVQNQSEYFEVRVAALDLLLSSNLSRSQFDQIVSAYKDKQPNSSEQHLQNYLYTTLQSLQNTTKFIDFLSDFATETLETVKIERAQIAKMTVNQRISITEAESNFGSSYQFRAVANPLTNSINTFHISNNEYAMSLDLMSYSIYIQFEGVSEYFQNLFKLTLQSTANPHLLDLIKKNHYKLMENPDFRIDVVIFMEDRAVFAISVDRNFMNTVLKTLRFDPIRIINFCKENINFLVIDHTTLVSEMGTPIQIKNDMRQLTTLQLEHSDYEYLRSRMSSSLFLQVESYNPLANTAISSYKCFDEQKAINLPLQWDQRNMILKWKNTEDMIQRVTARLIGTYVNNSTKLQEYCSTCDYNNEIPEGPYKTTNYSLGWLGFKDHSERSIVTDEQIALNSKEPKRIVGYMNFLKNIEANFDTNPLNKPSVYLSYFMKYNNYLSDDIERFYIASEPYYEEPTETIIKFHFDAKTERSIKTGMDISVAALNRNVILSQLNFTLKNDAAAQFDFRKSTSMPSSSYELRIDARSDNFSARACLDRNIFYPNGVTDKFTLEPFKSTEVRTVLSWGMVEPMSENCPLDKYCNFTETLSSTEDKIQRAKETEEYKMCQNDTTNLKYTPPTESCVAASKMITNYNLYKLNIDLTAVATDNDIDEEILHNYELISIKKLDENYLNVSLDTNLLLEGISKINYREASTAVVEYLLDPISVAYADYDVITEKSRTCHITPNYIKTFNEKSLPNYVTEHGKKMVAFVECTSTASIGMTVQRLNDYNVGFTIWLSDNKFSATVDAGHLKMVLNNNEITRDQFQQDEDEELKIYFLGDDVIYVKCNSFEVYYNTEYISIKTTFLGNICGVCKV